MIVWLQTRWEVMPQLRPCVRSPTRQSGSWRVESRRSCKGTRLSPSAFFQHLRWSRRACAPPSRKLSPPWPLRTRAAQVRPADHMPHMGPFQAHARGVSGTLHAHARTQMDANGQVHAGTYTYARAPTRAQVHSGLCLYACAHICMQMHRYTMEFARTHMHTWCAEMHRVC